MKLTNKKGDMFSLIQNKPKYFTKQSYMNRNLWLELLLIDGMNNKVLDALIRCMNDFNMVNTTAQNISDSNNVSVRTVRTVMKAMQDKYYLRKFSNGRYMINPALIFKTNGSVREECYAMYLSDDKEVLDKIREIKQKRRG